MSIDPGIIEVPRAFLAELFDVAVKAGNPLQGIKANLPKRPKGRVIVVGHGDGNSSWRLQGGTSFNLSQLAGSINLRRRF